MANVSFVVGPCQKTMAADFIMAINSGAECITEIAFANPGTSRFNSAIYFEKLTEAELLELAQSKANVGFATGFSKESMKASLAMGSRIPRNGSDNNIKLKNTISFDLDFKQNVDEYNGTQREQLTEEYSKRLLDALNSHKIPIWMMVFSGNGIHLHFRLNEAYELSSIQNYKRIYDAIRCYLECISSFKFDPACSNPSRLMRLPFSTNWKDRDNPIPCAVLAHDPEANFSPLFDGFRTMAEFKPALEQGIARDKKEILSSLNLIKVLDHFQYSKPESLKENGSQIICSSPFRLDANPSFYYDQQRKLFYDFSSGFGGDIFELIARLAKMDSKNDFANVLDLAAKISGVSTNDANESCFELNEKGLWYQSSKEADPQWISSPIFVEALTRDSSNQSWGRLLTFKDQDGITKSWSMPMELLAGDGSEIRRNLLNLGVELAVGKRERHFLLSYLQSSRPTSRARCVNRIGWHQDHFILPDRIYSPSQQEVGGIILQGSRSISSFGSSGSLKDWQENIGDFCAGNSRLVLAVSAALASVLLKATGEESGGFNFVGPSSIGKSITLKVAASVWGNPGLNGFIKRWRSTLNGLELLAASRCDSLLILDELGEIQPKDAGNASYMLCGGMSKNRATKDTNLANQFEWRLLFLSSSEITLAAHVAQSGAQINVGQEVRMLDIPAETAGSKGIFENTYGFESPGIFATTLAQAAEKYFGSAIHDFLSKVVENPLLIATLSDKRRAFVDSLTKDSHHGQIHRALKRFSLVAAVGELGIELGIFRWQPGEAFNSVQKCFNDWCASWAGGGSREKQQLVQQVKCLLQEFGASRFPLLHDFKDNRDVHHQQLWGFRKKAESGGYEWLVLSEIFKNNFCKGHEYRRALSDLKDENLLITGPQGQSSSPMRVPHLGVTRVVRIHPSILA